MRKSMSKKVICFAMVGSMLTTNFAFASEIKKDESVYVTLSENGAVKETIVSNWVHSDSKLGEFHDFSNLENIKNVKGLEKPNKTGDEIVWNSNEKDIYYIGDTKLEAPLGVKITYYLDDTEITPESIVGKNGTVKIKIGFENKAKQTVNVNGKSKEMYTPMTTVAVINLPEDTFTNVKAEDAQVISEGNNQVVTLIAFPGMKESLGLDKLGDADLDLKIPNEFEITAEAKDFKMKPIYITSTPMIPDVEGFEDAKDFGELKDGMTKLKDAVNDISKGSKDLASGINSAKDGAVKLNSGSSQLKDGSSKLANGSGQLKDGTGELVVGTNELKAGTGKLANGSSQLQAGTGEAKAKVDELVKDPMLKALPSIVSTENVNNVNNLVTDSKKLYTDGEKLYTDSKPMLNILMATPQLKEILDQSIKLNSKVDANQIQGLIAQQQIQGKEFIAGAEQVNTKENIDALKYAVSKCGDFTPEQKAGLVKVIDGYSGLVNSTKDNIVNTNEQLAPMASTLPELAKLQKDVADNEQIILGLSGALSNESIGNLSGDIQVVKNDKEKLVQNPNNKMFLQYVQDPKNIKNIQGLVNSMDAKLGEASKGINALNEGAKAINTGAEGLSTGVNKLYGGATKLNAGVSDLNTGANTLYSGAKALNEGTVSLVDGMNKLSDGSTKLSDGVDKFNEEGVKKIDSKVTPVIDDLDDVIASKDELVKLSNDYKSFSGIDEGMEGSVKFIMKTDEIKAVEVKEVKEEKVVEEKPKVSFFQWVKNLFN